MKLQSQVFQSTGTWDSLCEEVTAWVNENVPRAQLVSISVSESGRNILDSNGTVIVWYWA